MSNSDNIKRLLDNRMKSGEVQSAIIEGVSEQILDDIESIITSAQTIESPTQTSNPEDVRAKYDIVNPSLTGAALQTEVDKRRNIGDIAYVQGAVETFLSEHYSFAATPTVVVYPHEDLGKRGIDFMTATIQVPATDDNSTVINTDDPLLHAEIQRVIPKWYYFITTDTTSRSANYIRRFITSHTRHNFRFENVIPDDLRRVTASSESEELQAYEVKNLDWIPPATQLKLADNIIDGEDTEYIENTSEIRIEASSTFIDGYNVFTEKLTIDTELLGGFPASNPNIGEAGITGIAAEEVFAAKTYNIKDKEIADGEQPSVDLLEPDDYMPLTVTQEKRFITNDNKDSDILVGTHMIDHGYIDPSNAGTNSLAGREAKVFDAPVGGGYDEGDDLVANRFKMPEQFVEKPTGTSQATTGTQTIEFARVLFEGTTDQTEQVPRKIKQDQTGSFTFTVGNDLAAQYQPGMISFNAGSAVGETAWRDGYTFLNVQTMNVKFGNVQLTFTQVTGDLTPGTIVVDMRPDYKQLPNAGECRTFAIVVPDLFKVLSIVANEDPKEMPIDWFVEFTVDVIYDLYEYNDPANPTVEDIEVEEFSPPSDFRVVNTYLQDVPSEIQVQNGEWQYIDPDVGWQLALNPPTLDDHQSIGRHRLIYDKNQMPVGASWIRAFAEVEISAEENQGTVNLSIPIPSGYKCDTIDIEFRQKLTTQNITVNISDPSITDINSATAPVFKVVHLDTVIDATKSIDSSIATVILFYDTDKMDSDAIVTSYPTYSRPALPLSVNKDIEDLDSISFSVSTELQVDAWRHNLPTIYTTKWTEADTGDILDDPIGHNVTGGIIYYWKAALPEEGQFATVWITYDDLPGSSTPLPKDIEVLSVSVPEGNLLSFNIVGIPNYTLWYIDDIGVVHTFIDSFDIKTLEIHYDQNIIPREGVEYEVWATYGPPDLLANSAEDLISFSALSQYKMEKVEFEGLVPQEIFYELEENNIVDSLPTPKHVRNVLVRFKQFSQNADKVMVSFKPTYLRPLKRATYTIRQDWPVTSINPSGVLVKAVYINGEFDKMYNVTVNALRAQRLNDVKIYYYDNTLIGGEGLDISTTITVSEILFRKINPWIDGNLKWMAPSGKDEPYRIDLSGARVNRIEVSGVTNTAEPIRVIDKGWDKPYRVGTLYEPTQIKLFYSEISTIQIFYDETEPIYNNHRNNILFDDDSFWRSSSTTSDERLEVTSPSLLFNQMVVELDTSSLVPSEVYIRAEAEGDRWIDYHYTPATTTVDEPAGYPQGATRIKVADTTNFDRGVIVKTGNIYFKVQRNVDDTTLFVEPLPASVDDGDSLTIVGIDIGEPIESSKFVFNFLKGKSLGSIAIKQIRPRLERRFMMKALARYVLSDNRTSFWMSEGVDTPDTEQRLKIVYDHPVAFNRILYDEAYHSKPRVFVVDEYTKREKEIFLSQDVNEKGCVYFDPKKVDDPRYTMRTVTTQSIELLWETLPRNASTGLYQTKVYRCIPQFVYDTLHSRTRNMLDGQLHSRWVSSDNSSSEMVIILTADCEDNYVIDRLGITSQSYGTKCDIYTALGDTTIGYQYLTTINDVGAANPARVFTEALNANSGASQSDPKAVFVADTTGFEVGRFVNVRDDIHTVGEFYEIAAVIPNYAIILTVELEYDYTVANNAVIEQSNILCPGWYSPVVPDVNCNGDHIRGPKNWRDAYTLPSVTARYVQFRFTQVQENPDTMRRDVRINHLDLFKSIDVS